MTRNADTKAEKRDDGQRAHVFMPPPARRPVLDESVKKHLRKIAHEMRTPLGTIHIWIGLLVQGQLSEEATARALQAIKTSAASLKQIVDNVIEDTEV